MLSESHRFKKLKYKYKFHRGQLKLYVWKRVSFRNKVYYTKLRNHTLTIRVMESADQTMRGWEVQLAKVKPSVGSNIVLIGTIQ